MTSDGIAEQDWGRLQDAAVDYANATANAESASTELAAVLAILDELEFKYGRLPSLVATRADYEDDPNKQLQLLEEAFRIATDRADSHNLFEVAHSLASVYIDHFRDRDMARRWIEVVEKFMLVVGTERHLERYERLIENLDTLK